MDQTPGVFAVAKAHAAEELVQSAHKTMPKADEYLIGRIYYGPGEMPPVAPERPRHGYWIIYAPDPPGY
jgi:hypothetical protein